MKDKHSGPYLSQAAICKAFAHPTRLQLLDALSRGERGVSSLQESLNVTKTNLSQHLALLKARRQVRDLLAEHCAPDGKISYTSLSGEPSYDDNKQERAEKKTAGGITQE